MDYDKFVELVNKYGEDKLLVLYFDNDRIEFFKEEGQFKMSDVENVGGSAMHVTRSNILSKQGKNGKGGKHDIPIVNVNSEIQAVLFLENAEDRERVDWAELMVM
jgi:hypothetical protein